MTVCLLDTSVILNLLAVPGLAQHREKSIKRLEELRKGAKADLLLPFVSVIETGNHIAQLSDGGDRHVAARRFVDLVRQTLDGVAPWVVAPLPDPDRLAACLADFPSYAMRGIGFADRTIIEEWERQRRRWPMRRV